MAQNKLEGGIPEGLWSLTALQHLMLYTNRFTGTLSASVAKLTKLTFLSVALCPYRYGLPLLLPACSWWPVH